jgi:hypothetical protein
VCGRSRGSGVVRLFNVRRSQGGVIGAAEIIMLDQTGSLQGETAA